MKSSKSGSVADDSVQMSADCISAPGCYVCDWNGHVLRVQAENGQTRRSLMVSIVGSRPLTVTRISENPFIPLSEARLRASNMREDGSSAPAASAANGNGAGRSSGQPQRPQAQRSAAKSAAKGATRTRPVKSRQSGSQRARTQARKGKSNGRTRATARPKAAARRKRRSR
jgi:hypothetical protein